MPRAERGASLPGNEALPPNGMCKRSPVGCRELHEQRLDWAEWRKDGTSGAGKRAGDQAENHQEHQKIHLQRQGTGSTSQRLTGTDNRGRHMRAGRGRPSESCRAQGLGWGRSARFQRDRDEHRWGGNTFRRCCSSERQVDCAKAQSANGQMALKKVYFFFSQVSLCRSAAVQGHLSPELHTFKPWAPSANRSAEPGSNTNHLNEEI